MYRLLLILITFNVAPIYSQETKISFDKNIKKNTDSDTITTKKNRQLKQKELENQFELGLELYKKHDLVKSKVLLSSYLNLTNKKNKYNAFAYYLIGECENQLGNHKEAKKYYEISKNKLKLNQHKSSYLKKKTKQAIINCNWALLHQKDSLLLKINPLNNRIKTSQFTHQIDKEKIIISTSKQDTILSLDTINTHTIFETGLNNQQENEFNIQKLKNTTFSNASISKDGLTMYCSLYNHNTEKSILILAHKENEKWNIYDTIKGDVNQFEYNYTMPCLANIEGKDYLFFCSNEPTTKGGLDIYVGELSSENTLIRIRNLKEINSIDDDITPFYNSEKKELYFASKWLEGYGGYDLFETKFSLNGNLKIQNLKHPINSSYDDTYFCSNKDIILFSSNRKIKDENQICCMKIYYSIDNQELITKEEKKDTIKISATMNKKMSEKIEFVDQYKQISDLLPIILYFDNDHPNPKTNDTTTELTYTKTYQKYRELIPSYLKQEKDILKKKILSDFYNIEIVNENSKITILKNYLNYCSSLNISNQLEIKGYASPIAKKKYNDNLSKRRVITFTNEIKKMNIENINTIIKYEKFGEERSPKYVNDNINEKEKSVFSIEAAKERKIEITNIKNAKLENDTITFNFLKSEINKKENGKIKLYLPTKIINDLEIIGESTHNVNLTKKNEYLEINLDNNTDVKNSIYINSNKYGIVFKITPN